MHVRTRLLAVAVVLLAVACGSSDDASTPSSETTHPSSTTTDADATTSSTTTTTTTPSSTTTTTTAQTTTTTTTAPPATEPTPPPTSAAPEPPAPPTLERGDEGSEVERVQARLEELGYWVGTHDGVYGMLTEQAVYAFQKAQGLAVDGVLGPRTRQVLAAPQPVEPRSTAGTVWEIDKTRQLLILAVDGRARTIWNTSTGIEEPYTHDGRQLLADTPPGQFSISWQVDGWRDGALGRMWRPKYFHPDGIAIHGYGSVPPVPASHGCARVSMAAMDHIWGSGLAPVGAAVHVYGEAPG